MNKNYWLLPLLALCLTGCVKDKKVAVASSHSSSNKNAHIITVKKDKNPKIIHQPDPTPNNPTPAPPPSNNNGGDTNTTPDNGNHPNTPAPAPEPVPTPAPDNSGGANGNNNNNTPTPSSPNAPFKHGKFTTAKELLAYFAGLNGKGVLFGQQRGLDIAIAPLANADFQSDVYAMTQQYPAIIGLDITEIPHDPKLSTEENGKRMGNAIAQIDSIGSIATLSAHWRNPMPGPNGISDYANVDLNRVLPNGDLNSVYNNWLDEVVATAKYAVRADGSKIPFIFRPLHEANGNWFWWHYGHGGEEAYKKLFAYTINYIRQHGAKDQILAVFSPNANFNGDEKRYNQLYPGDDVVDILGYDSYAFNNNMLAKDKWVGEVVEDMAMLTRLAASKGKVAALTEFGRDGANMIRASGNTDLHFFTDLLAGLKANPQARKIAYMHTWANWGNTGRDFSVYTPWKGHEMESDFQAFERDEYTLFNRDISQ